VGVRSIEPIFVGAAPLTYSPVESGPFPGCYKDQHLTATLLPIVFAASSSIGAVAKPASRGAEGSWPYALNRDESKTIGCVNSAGQLESECRAKTLLASSALVENALPASVGSAIG